MQFGESQAVLNNFQIKTDNIELKIVSKLQFKRHFQEFYNLFACIRLIAAIRDQLHTLMVFFNIAPISANCRVALENLIELGEKSINW